MRESKQEECWQGWHSSDCRRLGDAPWCPESLPYFGWDIAEDLELVGNESPFHYVQLDGWGGRHWSNETDMSLFPPTSEPGFDIVRDLEVFGAETVSSTEP